MSDEQTQLIPGRRTRRERAHAHGRVRPRRVRRRPRRRDRYDGDQRKDFSRFAPQMIYRHRKLPPTATVGRFVDLAVAYAHRFAELTRR